MISEYTYKYVVVRKCCLQEDEGRNFVYAFCDSRKECEEYIDGIVKLNYFQKDDFLICSPQEYG